MEVRRSPELEAFAEQMREAGKTGDRAWLEQHLAAGEVVALGTDPREIFRGRDELLTLAAGGAEEMNRTAAAKWETDDVEFYEAGDAGWILVHGHLELSDGSAVPSRALTVLVRDQGEWKVTVNNVSVVVGNELLTPGSPLAQPATGS